MSKILTIVAIVVTLLLAGCAGQIHKLPGKIQAKDGSLKDAYITATTAGDTLDRSSTLVQIAYDSGRTDENGDPELIQLSAELHTGSTIAGQSMVGMLNGTGAAYIQKTAIENAARRKACPEGTEMCNSTYIGGASALSASESNSDSGANIDVNMSSSCPSGNCTPPPEW